MTDLFAEGFAHQNAGRLDDAIVCYRKLLAGSPEHGPARVGLALALLGQEKPEDAAEALRGGDLAPGLAAQSGIYFHVGWAFQARRRFAEAAVWFKRASEARPDFAEAHYNLGLAQQNQGQLDDAIGSYRRALALRPEMPEPRHNLALLLQILARHAEAIDVYREGLKAAPGNADFPRYLVGATFYDPAADNTARFDEAERFGARLRFPPGRPVPSYANSRDPERRLRIGYVTSDFKNHPVGRNMEPLLAARDRARFETVVYADVAHSDGATEQFQRQVDAWRSTTGLDDAAVADQIRADGIDILVCLAAHFDFNRPTIAAYRPAPIQISFHDVTTSGGDGTFDYLIADRVVAPALGTEQFTERVLRLPSIYVHAPLAGPEPGPPPCHANGYVTFGSLNNPAKLNRSVLAVWAQILQAVPNSRLAFKYQQWFQAAEVRERIISTLAVFGVDPDRLLLRGGDDRLAEHLKVYQGIDIALDPFPFTGSTATFEALWMGVPVVTLAGPTMMARWSASMLSVLHLDALVATDFDRYVAVAAGLARDEKQLASLRSGLREAVRPSPLCNGPLRARHLERLYRSVWRRWCRQPTSPAAIADLFAEGQRHHKAGDAVRAKALYRRVLSAAPDHAQAFHHLGILDLQAGRVGQAEDRIRHALALNPRDVGARINLGHALHRMERFEDAEGEFRAALAIDAFRAAALVGLGESLRAQRRPAEAIVAARKAVAIEPQNPNACAFLGAALLDSGQAVEALTWLRKAAAFGPPDARTYYNLGAALEGVRQIDEAMAAYRQALAFDADMAEAHNNLGLLLIERDDAASAARHLCRAVELRPGHATMHNNLGKALQHLGRTAEGLACFERSIALDPDAAEAYVNAGAGQRALLRFDDALATLRRALEIRPDMAEAHVNLALTLRDLGRLDEARAAVEKGLTLAPDMAELHTALGMVLNDLGLHKEARSACQRAVALKPDSVAARRSLLAVLIYGLGVTPEERFREHRRLGAIVGRARLGADSFKQEGSADRRLRVGYISSDLCRHPVGRNLRPIFAHHDRQKFEIFVYAAMSNADDVTEEFRGKADAWRPVAGLGERRLADMVRADGIDILVHLAGRFDRNLPGVAAHRPAPVQISLHDPATSGVEGMDYLIADAVLVPRKSSERFVERVVRLPSYYIHDPIRDAPAVGPLPSATTGAPTFGIFNNPAKLSDECLALWAEVLRRIPRARLLFKFRNRYQSEVLCRRIRDRLGAAAARVEIIPADLPHEASLAIYNRVDVALDPYPFTGSTTTFEALWMGVPVVTLATETMVGRWSASILNAVGLPEFVADASADYVDTAVGVCGQLDRLASLRQGLRVRVAASPLCDGRRRTRQIERVYRTLWGRWCRSGPPGYGERPD